MVNNSKAIALRLSTSFREEVSAYRHSGQLSVLCGKRSRILQYSGGKNLQFHTSQAMKKLCGFLIFLFSLGLFTALSPIHAQADPCPAACTKAITDHYLGGLSESFSDAHTAAASVAMPYIGTTRVNLVTVGAQAVAGVRAKDDDDTSFDTPSGEIKDLKQPISFIPYASYFAGVNVGSLLSLFGGTASGFLGLPNLDLIVARSSADEFISVNGVKFSFETSYYGIQYSVVGGRVLPIIGAWKGIVLGAGYMQSTVEFTAENNNPQDIFVGASRLSSTNEKLSLESKLTSIPIELKTGIEVLFFSFTATAGTLFHSGETELKFEREGSFSFNETDKSEPDAQTFYYKMGAEFTLFPFFRVGAEVSYPSQGSYAYSVATRINI